MRASIRLLMLKWRPSAGRIGTGRLLGWLLAFGMGIFLPPVHAQTGLTCGQRIELPLCRNQDQSLELTARSDSGGRLDCDYQWLTRYRLEGSLQNRLVWVRPDRDTCYLLQMTCPQGCTTIDTFCIRLDEPPQLAWQLPEFICSGDTSFVFLVKENIKANQIGINWNAIRLIDFLEDDASIAYRIVAPTAGFFTLMAEGESEAGCRASARAVLRVRERPTVDAGPDRALCQGDSVRLNGQSTGYEAGRCVVRWGGSARFDRPFAPATAVWADSSGSVWFQAECQGCWSQPDTVRLRVLLRPRIVADTHQLAFCRDQAGVQLPVRVEGGTPPYFARWEPPFALDDPLAVAPFAAPPRDTAWTLSLQDDPGCAAQPLTLRVRVYSLPVADAGPDLSYCLGKPDTLRLRGRVLRPDSTPVPPADWGRYAVRWVPEDGLSDPTSLTPIASPDRTTIYTLTLRDRLTGCTNRITILDTLATAVVRVLAVPRADAGPDTIRVCSGDPVRLGGVATGGDDLTYRWRPVSSLNDPSAANPIARPFQSSRYVVQVANGPCLGIADSIEIIVRERPVVRLDGPLDVCDGDTLPILIQSRGGTPPYAYEWSAPDRVIERAGGGVGWVARYPEAIDVLVRIRDRFCESDETSELKAVVLAKPVVNIWEDQLEICRGDTLRIDTQVESPISTYRISWTPPDSLIRPDVLSPLAFPDQSTVYRVEARIGRCVSYDSVLFAVLPVPRLRIEGGPDRLCEGESIRFRAIADPSDGFRWVWRQANGTLRQLPGPEVQDRPEASLRYRAEAVLGPCTTTVEVPVVVFPQAEADFEASAAGGCGIWEVAFRNTSRKADAFAWDFGDGWGRSSLREPTYRYPLPGRWQVQLIAGAGTPCPDTVALPIAFQHTSMPKAVNFIFSYNENEILYLPQSQIQIAWSSAEVARAVWDLGDGTQTTDSAVSHRYRQAGDYLIRLLWQDSAGCSRVDSLPRLRVREPEVDIPTVFTPNGDGIHDHWEISYAGIESYRLQVFDRLGRILFESSSSIDPWLGTDQTGRAVADGAYLYLLRIGGKLHRGQVSVIR